MPVFGIRAHSIDLINRVDWAVKVTGCSNPVTESLFLAAIQETGFLAPHKKKRGFWSVSPAYQKNGRVRIS